MKTASRKYSADRRGGHAYKGSRHALESWPYLISIAVVRWELLGHANPVLGLASRTRRILPAYPRGRRVGLRIAICLLLQSAPAAAQTRP